MGLLERWLGSTGLGEGSAEAECKACGARLGSARALVAHLVRKHFKGSPFPCLVGTCGETLLSVRQLYEHLRRHAGEDMHACGVCRRSFATAGSLRRHARLGRCVEQPEPAAVAAEPQEEDETPEQQKPRRQVRGRGRAKKRRARTTRARASAAGGSTASGSGPNRCTCGARFALATDLYAHERVAHDRYRDHACDRCERAFTSPARLRRHVEREHGAEQAAEQAAEVAEEVAAEVTAEEAAKEATEVVAGEEACDPAANDDAPMPSAQQSEQGDDGGAGGADDILAAGEGRPSLPTPPPSPSPAATSTATLPEAACLVAPGSPSVASAVVSAPKTEVTAEPAGRDDHDRPADSDPEVDREDRNRNKVGPRGARRRDTLKLKPDRSWRCTECGARFADDGLLRKHLARHLQHAMAAQNARKEHRRCHRPFMWYMEC